MVKKISPNTWQMLTFLNPLDALIPKIPFIFCRFLGLGHPWGPGVRLGRILGGPSIEPFLGERGIWPEGSIDPPPRPETKARAPSQHSSVCFLLAAGICQNVAVLFSRQHRHRRLVLRASLSPYLACTPTHRFDQIASLAILTLKARGGNGYGQGVHSTATRFITGPPLWCRVWISWYSWYGGVGLQRFFNGKGAAFCGFTYFHPELFNYPSAAPRLHVAPLCILIGVIGV